MTASNNSIDSNAPAKAWRHATVRCGTTLNNAAKASSSIAIGVSRSIRASAQRPGSVSNTSSAKNRVESARLAAATSAPSVSTVQYTRNRLSFGRAVGTRQILLKTASTLPRVTSNETISASAPKAVSCCVFWMKPIR